MTYHGLGESSSSALDSFNAYRGYVNAANQMAGEDESVNEALWYAGLVAAWAGAMATAGALAPVAAGVTAAHLAAGFTIAALAYQTGKSLYDDISVFAKSKDIDLPPPPPQGSFADAYIRCIPGGGLKDFQDPGCQWKQVTVKPPQRVGNSIVPGVYSYEPDEYTKARLATFGSGACDTKFTCSKGAQGRFWRNSQDGSFYTHKPIFWFPGTSSPPPPPVPRDDSKLLAEKARRAEADRAKRDDSKLLAEKARRAEADRAKRDAAMRATSTAETATLESRSRAAAAARATASSEAAYAARFVSDSVKKRNVAIGIGALVILGAGVLYYSNEGLHHELRNGFRSGRVGRDARLPQAGQPGHAARPERQVHAGRLRQ